MNDPIMTNISFSVEDYIVGWSAARRQGAACLARIALIPKLTIDKGVDNDKSNLVEGKL